jgi:hypothetical protein
VDLQRILRILRILGSGLEMLHDTLHLGIQVSKVSTSGETTKGSLISQDLTPAVLASFGQSG